MRISKRKFMALGVLVVGAVVGLVIITTDRDAESNRIDAVSKPTIEQFLAFSSTPTTNISQQNLQYEPYSPSLPDLGETDNFTELLARQYATNILTEGEQALDTNALIRTFQDQSTEKLRPLYFTEEDIVVSSDNSLSAQITYINIVKPLLWADDNDSGLGILSLFINQGVPDNIAEQVTEELVSQLDKMLRTTSPLSWRVFHLDLVNLWQEKILVFQSLSELQSDPLKAYMALQLLPAVMQQDSESWLMLTGIYEDTGRHKYNTHSWRKRCRTEYKRNNGEDLAHGYLRHTKYLAQYMHYTIQERIEAFRKAEIDLAIDGIEKATVKISSKDRQIADITKEKKEATRDELLDLINDLTPEELERLARKKRGVVYESKI